VTARMLSIAESAERDIVTLCNGCYLSLKEANHLLRDQGREEVDRTLGAVGRHYRGGSEVFHLLDLVMQRREEVMSSLVREMEIDLAIHPGCHLSRPSSVVDAEGPFRPGNLAEVAGWTGAGIAHRQDWPSCCGGGLSGVDDELSYSIFKETVWDFLEAGAEAILTPCPFCFVQFDSKQKELPVLYLSELLALSMGLDGKEIGLQHHRVKPGL
ncbi:MAG: heterodisulfide reductase-related iron-sulfur binding cluster, partial [Methanomassiliicoccales archaeon]